MDRKKERKREKGRKKILASAFCWRPLCPAPQTSPPPPRHLAESPLKHACVKGEGRRREGRREERIAEGRIGEKKGGTNRGKTEWREEERIKMERKGRGEGRKGIMADENKKKS